MHEVDNGIGWQRQPIRNVLFRKHFVDLLGDVRSVQQAPVLWDKANAFKLKMPSAKQNPCAHSRLVFSFDPIGKGFFAQLIECQSGETYDEHVHAYLKHRRRESAVMTSLVVPFTLNSVKLQCLNMFNDKTNAFLSIDRNHAARAATEIVDEWSRQIVYKHILFSTFVLQCPDRDVCFLPRDGILPGSSLVVRVWVQSFSPVIRGLIEKFEAVDDKAQCTVVRSPAGKLIDVGFPRLRMTHGNL